MPFPLHFSNYEVFRCTSDDKSFIKLIWLQSNDIMLSIHASIHVGLHFMLFTKLKKYQNILIALETPGALDCVRALEFTLPVIIWGAGRTKSKRTVCLQRLGWLKGRKGTLSYTLFCITCSSSLQPWLWRRQLVEIVWAKQIRDSETHSVENRAWADWLCRHTGNRQRSSELLSAIIINLLRWYS